MTHIYYITYGFRVEQDDLEDLSCTDLEQQWGKLKATHCQSYTGKKLEELCHVSEKEENSTQITDEMRKKWSKILMDCKLHSSTIL